MEAIMGYIVSIPARNECFWDGVLLLIFCVQVLHTEVSNGRATQLQANIKAAQTKPEKIQGEKGKTETNRYTRQRFTTKLNVNQLQIPLKRGKTRGTNNNWG